MKKFFIAFLMIAPMLFSSCGKDETTTNRSGDIKQGVTKGTLLSLTYIQKDLNTVDNTITLFLFRSGDALVGNFNMKTGEVKNFTYYKNWNTEGLHMKVTDENDKVLNWDCYKQGDNIMIDGVAWYMPTEEAKQITKPIIDAIWADVDKRLKKQLRKNEKKSLSTIGEALFVFRTYRNRKLLPLNRNGNPPDGIHQSHRHH